MRGSILYLLLVWISAFAKMTEGVSPSFPCNSVLVRGKCIYFADQVASWSPSPRALVTLAYAGVHSLLAVSMDFRIRANDGKGFPPLFRVIRCSSVANASSLQTVANASGSDFILLLRKPSLTLVFSAKRLARKKNHRSIVGKEYWEEGPIFPG